MKLSDFREDYYEFSGKVSDLVRQLGFAGLGTIWIFKHESAGQINVPKELIPVAALIILALTLDFLQYVIATMIWGRFARRHEKKGKRESDELTAPPWSNMPANICFWGKVLIMVIAYGLLLAHLFSSFAR